MIKTHLILAIAIALTLTINGCYNDNEEELYPGSTTCDTANVTYTASVAPIFAANCNACHSGNAPSGNVKTDNYTSVVTNITRIRGAVNHETGFMAMPQNSAKLSVCDLDKIDIWIRQGMPDN